VRTEKIITAENQWTDPVPLRGQDPVLGPGYFDMSVSGVFSATVTVQRSFDGGATWGDVQAFAAPVETVGMAASIQALYRIGVKTGDFTSGTVHVLLAQ
jgi:hypothetical protein